MRMAARAASAAAPVFPRDPPTTSRWPYVPLWASRGRSGKSRATSARSTRNVAMSRPTSSSGIPMGTTCTRPASAAPGPASRPRFRPAKVAVTAARTAGPGPALSVRRRARGNVERDHRAARGVDQLDHPRGEAGGRPARPGAQQGIDDQVGLAQVRRHARLVLDAPGPQSGRAERAQLLGGVTPNLGLRGHQPHRWPRARPLEPAGGHESVAAVAALAADDIDPRVATPGSEALEDDVGGPPAGTLHQDRARNAERADGARVEPAHLVGGEDGAHGYRAAREAPALREGVGRDLAVENVAHHVIRSGLPSSAGGRPRSPCRRRRVRTPPPAPCAHDSRTTRTVNRRGGAGVRPASARSVGRFWVIPVALPRLVGECVERGRRQGVPPRQDPAASRARSFMHNAGTGVLAYRRRAWARPPRWPRHPRASPAPSRSRRRG